MSGWFVYDAYGSGSQLLKIIFSNVLWCGRRLFLYHNPEMDHKFDKSENLAFRVWGHIYSAHSLYLTFGKKLEMLKADFNGLIACIKG